MIAINMFKNTIFVKKVAKMKIIHDSSVDSESLKLSKLICENSASDSKYCAMMAEGISYSVRGSGTTE